MRTMTIKLSEHGIERLKERLSCTHRKMDKIVRKAWNSKELVLKGDLSNANWHDLKNTHKGVYRKMMGYIWTFRIDKDEIIFVTVFAPPSSMARRKFVKSRVYKRLHK